MQIHIPGEMEQDGMGWDGIMCQTVINPFSGFWGLLARKKKTKKTFQFPDI